MVAMLALNASSLAPEPFGGNSVLVAVIFMYFMEFYLVMRLISMIGKAKALAEPRLKKQEVKLRAYIASNPNA